MFIYIFLVVWRVKLLHLKSSKFCRGYWKILKIKNVQGRNGGATAHFCFLAATQQVVSRQEGRGVRDMHAQQRATTRARSHDLGVARATCFSWPQVATSILCRDINSVSRHGWQQRGSRHGHWARDLTSFGPRSRHQFEVMTWLRLGLVGLGRDMNFMSRHEIDSLRS